MSAMRRVPDPYRVLGVNRGADATQIKAAHRRLAKRHHPDAPGGDEDRFVAVQEAYQLLSDPLRRREWDRSHAPGPVDARERGTRASARAASARWTREDAGGAYRRTRTARGATGAHRRDDAGAAAGAPGSGRDPGAATGAHGSGRNPGTRRTTWSAEGVPWWEDFTPKGRAGRAASDPRAADRRGGRPMGQGGAAPGEPRPSGDMDAFVRSSGAAWSSAARRHFRRDEATLPSRGAFRYRGTQVVTGAEARKVAADEAAATADAAADVADAADAADEAAAALFRRARPAGSDTPPSRAFDHDEPEPRRAARSATATATARATATAASDAAAPTAPPVAGPPTRPAPPRAASTPSRPERTPVAQHERNAPGPVVIGALLATAIAAIPVVLGASAGAVDPAAPPAIGALALGALIGGLAGWLVARLASRTGA